MANTIIAPVSNLAKLIINTDQNTMGWGDLTAAWLFQSTDEPVLYFGVNDVTTKNIQQHNGVLVARAMAIEKIRRGELNPSSYQWRYDKQQFFEGIMSGNLMTSFLGTYTTDVMVTENSDGSYTLHYDAYNPSRWTSATRYRLPAEPGGDHRSIIPIDRLRDGPGIDLGETMEEHWQWSETIINP